MTFIYYVKFKSLASCCCNKFVSLSLKKKDKTGSGQLLWYSRRKDDRGSIPVSGKLFAVNNFRKSKVNKKM